MSGRTKSFGELPEITQVGAGGVFAVNNAADTVTSRITIENLTAQIAASGSSAATTIEASSTSLVDLDSYTTAGNYTCTTSGASEYVSNQPIIAGTPFNLTVIKVLNSNTYLRQYYYPYNSNSLYVRISTDSGSNWSAWKYFITQDNMPTLGTAAAKNIPSSGNASSTEVVMGDDTRLTDSRNAADVSSWAKAANKPTYNGSEININAAQTGAAQSSIASSISASTSVDSSIGTLLNNDTTLNSQIGTLTNEVNSQKQALSNEVTTRATLGAHNLAPVSLDYIYSEHPTSSTVTWNGNTIVKRGVSVTVNNDKSLTISGSNTDNAADVVRLCAMELEAGTYVLSGALANSLTNYGLVLQVSYLPPNPAIASTGDNGSVSFTLAEKSFVQIRVYIGKTAAVPSGQTITFKPMVRMAEDSDTTYRPYVPTNSQLLSYKDNGVLGAKNWLDLSETNRSTNANVTVTATSTGIRVQNATAGTYRRAYYGLLNLKKNTQYKLNVDVIVTAGVGKVILADGTTSENLINSNVATGSYSIPFNTGNNANLSIGFYCTGETSAIGDVTYNNLMITLSTDTDPTYQPYAKPNTELTKDDIGLTANAFANGAVNLLENTGTSNTSYDVTFVKNSDGTVTTSGTSTHSDGNKKSIFTVYNGAIDSSLLGKRVRLSGCPADGATNKFYLVVGLYDSNNTSIGDLLTEIGSGLEFTILSNTVRLAVEIRTQYNVNVTGKVFKPMLTLADMPNSDYNHYVPYVKSNKELTDELAIKTATVPVYTHADESVTYATLKKIGNVVNMDIQFSIDENDTPLSATSLGQVPSEYRPHSTVGAQAISLRTAATWANATYINAYITVTGGGYITLRGNDTELATGKYLSGNLTYIV